MKIGNREFPLGEKSYVMGILNVTPGLLFQMVENITI